MTQGLLPAGFRSIQVKVGGVMGRSSELQGGRRRLVVVRRDLGRLAHVVARLLWTRAGPDPIVAGGGCSINGISIAMASAGPDAV